MRRWDDGWNSSHGTSGRTSLQLLLGAVACPLLIACANVANLQLAGHGAQLRDRGAGRLGLGVRMALGAPRRHVLGLLLGMGGRLVLLGLAVGIPASLAATRLLRSQLFGVTPGDPLAYVAVTGVLGFVAFIACYIPARRAASVDPLVALREE